MSTFVPTIIRNRADVLVISIPFRKQFIFDKLWYFPISVAIFKTAPSSATTTIASLRKETITKKISINIFISILEKNMLKKLTLTYTKPKLTLQLCWSACCTQMLGKYTKYGRIYADTLIE